MLKVNFGQGLPLLTSRNQVQPILQGRGTKFKRLLYCLRVICSFAEATCHLIEQFKRCYVCEEMHAPKTTKLLQHLLRDVARLGKPRFNTSTFKCTDNGCIGSEELDKLF